VIDFLATASATAGAADGLKDMPWEKLGIVGISYFCLKLMADVAKARMPSKIMNSKSSQKSSCPMGPSDSARIGAIHHALHDRDGVIARDHAKLDESQLKTAMVLDGLVKKVDEMNRR